MTRLRCVPLALAVTGLVLLPPRPLLSQPDRLSRWLEVVNAHVPGRPGPEAIEAAVWPKTTLEALIDDVRTHVRSLERNRRLEGNQLLLVTENGRPLKGLRPDDFVVLDNGVPQKVDLGSFGRSLVIVFSDGVDTASWLSPASVLESAKRSDAVVYGVEIGRNRASFPRDLSSATGGRLIEIESTRDLAATFSGILDEFRTRYLVSYSPRGVTTGGWHQLDVRIKGRNATVKARPGYLSGL